MKQIAAIIMVMIMLALSLEAFARDGLNLKESSITEKLENFEIYREPLDKEMQKLEAQIDFILAQYGEDPGFMNNATLTELISIQKKYVSGKQSIIEDLKQIYVPSYKSDQKTVEELLSVAVYNATKNCRVFDKMVSKCLNKQEALIFQVNYLRLHIDYLNTMEDSIQSQINSMVAQENNILYL